jgi:hypothetical protein
VGLGTGLGFVAANLTNAVICAALTPIAWGLRGSAYTPGRPTPEDVRLGYAYDGLLVAALVLNLGVVMDFVVVRIV